MKKRLLVLLVVMSLIIGLVGGCTKNDEQTDASSTDNTDAQTQDNQEETEKIVLSLTWWGNQARNDLTQKAIALYMENNPTLKLNRSLLIGQDIGINYPQWLQEAIYLILFNKIMLILISINEAINWQIYQNLLILGLLIFQRFQRVLFKVEVLMETAMESVLEATHQ